MHTGYKSVSAEPCCLIDSFQVWWQYSKMGKKKQVNDMQIWGATAHLVRRKHNQRPAKEVKTTE